MKAEGVVAGAGVAGTAGISDEVSKKIVLLNVLQYLLSRNSRQGKSKSCCNRSYSPGITENLYKNKQKKLLCNELFSTGTMRIIDDIHE